MRIQLFLLFLLFNTIVFAQELESYVFLTSKKDVAQITKGSDEVGVFAKVEIGYLPNEVVLTKLKNFVLNKRVPVSEMLNPYLSWQLRYKAIFIHEKSGKKKAVEGFYYQDFDRKPKENHWAQKTTSYPIRFRVALPEAGKWRVEIMEWVEGKASPAIPASSIDIQSSSRSGFVKVHANKKNFERGGKMIYPVGSNLFSPYVDNNLYYSGNPKDKLNLSTWTIYLKDVERYSRQGGKYIRFIMEPTSSEIEFEKLGNYTDRLHLAWEMDHLFDLAEERDLMIQLNCMIQSPFKIFDNEFKSWDFGKSPESERSSYAYSEAFMLTKPSEIITNQEAFRYFKERYRYIMARWGYSPQITFLELMSEPFWMNQDDRKNENPYDSETGDSPTRKAVAQFHHQMAQYIKEELGYTDHLIAALGHMPPLSNPFYPNEPIGTNDNSWESPFIDVISMNVYKASASHFRISSTNVFSDRLKNLSEHYQKPIYLSETQTGDVLGNCSNKKTLPVDIMTTGFIGAAGFNLWEVFYHQADDQGRDDRSIWTLMIQAQDYMQFTTVSTLSEGQGKYQVLTQVASEKMGLFKKAENIKEIHYYLGEEGKDVSGVLMNRSYNIYTNRVSDSCECFQLKNLVTNNNLYYETKNNIGIRSNELVLPDLEGKKRYKVNFYAYKTGKLLESAEVKANGSGKLKIEHPVLEVESDSVQPAIWFSIQQIQE